MLRCILATTAALVAGIASAASISRSEQPVIVLFETGNHVEATISWGSPTVDGVDGQGNPTGNVADENFLLSAGIKKDINEKWSAALIYDQPFGADIDYSTSSLLFGGAGGTNADVDALALTGLARYRINETFSIHGGLRLARFGGSNTLSGAAFGPLSGYSFDGDNAWGLGGVVGAAFEIPKLALRVILTYSSEINFEIDTTEVVFGNTVDSITDVNVPQSVNLDFQTGIAEGTLLIGQVRWVNWDGWEIRPEGLNDAVPGGATIASKDYNIFQYKFGVGRQFNEVWAGAIQVNYTPDENNVGGVLDAVDGSKGLALSGTYSAPSGVKVVGAAQYAWLGNSDIRAGAGTAEFRDSTAFALSLKLVHKF